MSFIYTWGSGTGIVLQVVSGEGTHDLHRRRERCLGVVNPIAY